MPQGARAAVASPVRRILALVSAGVLVATLVGVVASTRSASPTGGPSARAAAAAGASSPTRLSAVPAADSPALPGAQPAPAARHGQGRSPVSTGTVVTVDPSRPGSHQTTVEHGVRFVHACSQDVAPGQVACYAERPVDTASPSGDPATGQVAPLTPGPVGLHPQDLQDAYDLPSATAGSGQTVYVVDARDDPTAESDLAVYRQTFGLPACTSANGCFTKLNQLGQTGPLPAEDVGWAQEITLDLDMVSAICPNCHITLIEATSGANSDVYAGVATANRLGAKFVSMSWGGAEPANAKAAKAMDSVFAATGVVYTAASGDDGYANGVIYPATSNRVIAVGGTALSAAPSTARGWAESAWVDAGSGCSTIEAPATWQVDSTPCSRRGITDVSAVADPATGVSVYETYGGRGWDRYGGTSAATPIIASAYALAGPPAPAVNPAELLYQHPHSLYDITSGSNGSCSPSLLCHGSAGWDGPTGLGTPHGLGAFELGRSAHTTSPGSTVAPGWPAKIVDGP